MSAAIAAPSSSGRVPPSDTTGETTSTSSPTRARKGYPCARAAARPAGELRRQGQQQRAADLERGARPRVAALVRHPHGAERLRAARDALDQLAPVARLEVLEVDPRHGDRRQQPGRGGGRQRHRVPPRRHPLAGHHQRARRRRRRHPQQRAAGAEPGDHPLPLQRAQRGERGEPQQPRRPQRQQRVGSALGCAHRADSISFWRSSIRRILPVSVFGSSSTNSIRRGYA